MTRTRALRIGAALLLLLVVALIVARIALRPDRVAGFVLSSLGDALGLEITTRGESEYTLRGGPVLVVRGVTVREPASKKTILTAARILVSVPWSTVRGRGATLDVTRIELDAPVLDVAALQAWLAARPPSDSALPTLRDGLHVNGGRIDGDGWRVDALDVALPRFAADLPVAARVSGRYRAVGGNGAVDGSLSVRFELSAAATRPSNDAGVALLGRVTATGADWRVPTRLRASGLVHSDADGLRIPRLRASLAGAYEALPPPPDSVPLAFAVAITSPLSWTGGTLTLVPAGLALRGDEAIRTTTNAATQLVPVLDARAAIALRAESPARVDLGLDGRIARWPDGWPALPAPLSASASALPVTLRYAGALDGSEPLSLQLRRDGTRFDARLRVADVVAWATRADAASPLPPISGTLASPRLDVSGVQLEGVEIEFDEPTLPPSLPRPAPSPAPTP